ncbi:c-type cytochrome [Duganella sp. FT92W]|uniref:C-type cytochrome n=2 Tax=Pseudoduganella rivuli TaxID=2666085 RepID=A0A7X2LSE0_9BURK|nr:c-type cytochrome [Pseudoduganella rivuli]MRV72181.1 c-type cytochrome [Pseudoduganella rivuli]
MLAPQAYAAPAKPVALKELPDTMAQRVAACTACHTAGANVKADAQAAARGDVYFPRIAGKPAGYLYNQLRNFREGRRHYAMMTYMTEQLSDAYLMEIAEYFASLHPPYPAPGKTSATAAMLERGRVLALQGDPQKKVPACVACHGDKLTGVVPAIPGLVGLPRDYINAQFGAWRDKGRRAHAPDCMADIAARLSDQDIAAVSGWLAQQPADAAILPAETIARPLPIACGSAPDNPATSAPRTGGQP